MLEAERRELRGSQQETLDPGAILPEKPREDARSNPQLDSDRRSREAAREVAERQFGLGELLGQVGPHESSVGNGLGDALAGERVDSSSLADEHDPQSRVGFVQLEPALGVALQAVALEVETAFRQ